MGQPYIYMKGNRNEWLLFDSGYANGNIMINNKSKLIKHQQKPIKQIYYPLKAMVSEEIKLGSFFNQKIQLGNFTSIMQIVKYEKGNNNLIGNQLIQNNDVIIDVLNNKFYITPFQKQTANESISNINFVYKNNAIVVSKLTKNSSLQKMGININDTIVSINNKSLEGIKTACDFDQFTSQMGINKQNDIKIEIKKNNKIEKYSISQKQLYE
jgi:predicted metalloprotease with PDZ domain